MSRIDGLLGDGWPSATDLALLTALLHQDPVTASDAWHRFREAWDPDVPSVGQYHLYPLLGRRLETLDPEEERLGMLRGVGRRSAVQTMLQLNQLEHHLAMLEALDIRPVVLKGPALTLSVYDHIGERWFADADLLVDPAEYDRAEAVLLADGWVPQLQDFEGNHGVNFARGTEAIDLHRQPHPELVVPGRLADTMTFLRTATAPRSLPSGRSITTLAPTESLLHIIVHGTQRLPPVNLRWPVDAERLITRCAIDWDRLVALATLFRVAPIVHDGLVVVERVTGRPVPDGVLGKLAAVRLSRLDMARIRAFHESPTPGRWVGKAATPLSWTIWRTRHLTPLGLLRAAPGELARGLNQRSVWSLPVLALRRLRRLRLRP